MGRIDRCIQELPPEEDGQHGTGVDVCHDGPLKGDEHGGGRNQGMQRPESTVEDLPSDREAFRGQKPVHYWQVSYLEGVTGKQQQMLRSLAHSLVDAGSTPFKSGKERSSHITQ